MFLVIIGIGVATAWYRSTKQSGAAPVGTGLHSATVTIPIDED